MTRDLFDVLDYRAWLRDWFREENELRARQRRPPMTHRLFHERAGLTNVGTLMQVTEYERRLTPKLLSHFIVPLEIEPDSLEHRYLRALIDLEAAERHLSEAERHLRAEREIPAERAQERAIKRGIREKRRMAGALTVGERSIQDAREGLAEVHATIRSLRDLNRARLIEGNLSEILSSLLTATVLELSRVPEFRPEPDWIAGRLLIPATSGEIETALAALRATGELPDAGAPAPIYRTPEAVPAHAVQAYYQAASAASADEMPRLFGPDRLAAQAQQRLGGLTVAIPSSRLADLQKLALKIQNDVAAFLQGLEGERDVVFQLLLHLFPLTASMTGSDGK
jgi:hypothetical protein